MKAIIHIGLHKTGTTTIQHFLAANRPALDEQGFHFASGCRYYTDQNGNKRQSGEDANHAMIAWLLAEPGTLSHMLPLYQIDAALDNAEFRKRELREFRKQIESLPEHIHTLIFSAEVFSTSDSARIAALHDFFTSIFSECRIAVYLRDQTALIPSFITTAQRWGATNDSYNEDDWDGQLSWLNYEKLLRDWESVFGRENICARIFDRAELLANDLIADFASACGFAHENMERIENRNVSLSPEVNEFLWRFNRHTLLSDETVDPLRDDIVEVLETCFPPTPHRHVLSRENAKKIIERYQVPNDWVAGNYFNRERLFEYDMDSFSARETRDALTLETAVEIAAACWREKNRRILEHLHHIEKQKESFVEKHRQMISGYESRLLKQQCALEMKEDRLDGQKKIIQQLLRENDSLRKIAEDRRLSSRLHRGLARMRLLWLARATGKCRRMAAALVGRPLQWARSLGRRLVDFLFRGEIQRMARQTEAIIHLQNQVRWMNEEIVRLETENKDRELAIREAENRLRQGDHEHMPRVA